MAENVVITTSARKKMVHARAGVIELPKIIGVAFGTGGVDLDGTVIAPTEMQEELYAEIYRQDIDGFEFVSDTTCRYSCTLNEDTLANTEISELGLYDEDGDLVCIKTFLPKGKDVDLIMSFSIDDVF